MHLEFFTWRHYQNEIKKKTNNIQDLVLKEYQSEWSNYDVIIGEPISINSTKFMKILKYGKLAMIRNPKAMFFKKGRTNTTRKV